ncbi:hypothetical protein SMICM304S_07136 [Streptomyces microflavus]
MRKIEKSSSGSGRRRCLRANAHPPTTAASPAAAMGRSAGSGFAVSLIAMTSPTRATSARSDEGRSHFRPGSATLGGARTSVATIAATTTGTLIRNTDPHQKLWSSSPLMIGPSALPTIASVPQIAMATLRSRSSSNVMRISASVAGIIAAAPTASSARAAIRVSGVPENAAASEAAPKTTRPIRNILRWPTRSPRVPLPSRSPAITTG